MRAKDSNQGGRAQRQRARPTVVRILPRTTRFHRKNASERRVCEKREAARRCGARAPASTSDRGSNPAPDNAVAPARVERQRETGREPGHERLGEHGAIQPRQSRASSPRKRLPGMAEVAAATNATCGHDRCLVGRAPNTQEPVRCTAFPHVKIPVGDKSANRTVGCSDGDLSTTAVLCPWMDDNDHDQPGDRAGGGPHRVGV